MPFLVRSFSLRNSLAGPLAGMALALLIGLSPGVSRGQEMLAGPVEASLLRVIDGDTLLVRARVWLDIEVVTRVRLRDVNAPELRARSEEERERAQAARAFVATLTDGAVLRLSEIGQDKYGGRVVARVSAGGEDLGAALLSQGHGRPMGARGRREPG
jgi:endonuclease YncB( thermonuclease family)